MKTKRLSNKFKQKNPRNKQTKLFLKFDEDARVDYLTGFHRRKNERRKKAKEEMLEKLKEQKQELKDKMKKKMSAVEEKRMNELQEAMNLHKQVDMQEYDLPSHTVTVTDLSGTDFAGKTGMMLGNNTLDENTLNDGEVTTKEAVSIQEGNKKFKRELKKLEKRKASFTSKKSDSRHKRLNGKKRKKRKEG